MRDGTVADNSLDFVSVALHEVGHVLGFVSGVDDGDWLNVVTEARDKGKAVKDDAMKFATPLDLFRYGSEGQIDLSMGTEAYFSIDGGRTNLGNFSTGEYSDFGGDGFQASHWKQSDDNSLGIMDPVLKLGQVRQISSLDTKAMDVMGWDVVNPGELNWQELYDNASDEAEDALIEDRDKDVEKMIKESENYQGRRGNSRGRSRRNQLSLWQNIKFQTLDLSTVEVELEPVTYENLVIAEYLVEVQPVDPVVQNQNEQVAKVSVDSLEVAKVSMSFLETQVTEVKEQVSLDLSVSGRLISKGIEDLGSLEVQN